MTIIAISGPHGAGKSTIAKAIAREFGLRYISAGEIFRKKAKEMGMDIITFTQYVNRHPEIDNFIDQLMLEEAKKGTVVLDSQLAYWMVREFNPIRILIVARREDRIRRIMEREKIPYEKAKLEVDLRDENEKERFKRLYGIELWNPRDFHLIINTSKFSKIESTKIAICACKILMKRIKNKR